jgi:dihydropteroate synthase
MQLRCADRVLALDRPVVMGILNVTPDSFADGARYLAPDAALAHAELMIEEGAAIIDVGGESTRPGAQPVTTEEELRRVLPVLERIAGRLPSGLILSLDTSNPELMRRAHASGVHLINDTRALRVPGALDAVAASPLGVCLMHMRGEPPDMQRDPRYTDVVSEVRDYLGTRLQACEDIGIARERLCIDPGFGFGKLPEHNVALLRGLPALGTLGRPLLVGLSRKSFVAAALSRAANGPSVPASARLAGSIALAVIAALRGARIVRAHDVGATLQALRVTDAVAQEGDG